MYHVKQFNSYCVAGDVFQAAFLGIVVLLEHVWCHIKCACGVFRKKAMVQPNPSRKNTSKTPLNHCIQVKINSWYYCILANLSLLANVSRPPHSRAINVSVTTPLFEKLSSIWAFIIYVLSREVNQSISFQWLCCFRCWSTLMFLYWQLVFSLELGFKMKQTFTELRHSVCIHH